METYLRLGGSADDAVVRKEGAVTRCSAPAQLSFCNFGVDFDDGGDEQVLDETLERLHRLGRHRFYFRLFAISGDRPENIVERLTRIGYSVQHELAMMACPGDAGAPELNLIRAETEAERRDMATFMARQFFWRQASGARQGIVAATARAETELYAVGSLERPLAAAMLVSSPGALGLYNLCVSSEARRNGLGTAILNEARRRAGEAGAVLTLQCEERLAPWYEQRGLETCGSVHALAFRGGVLFDRMLRRS